MRVLISGASGLIGTELGRQLSAAGHTPLRLVRREARGPGEYRWNPTLLSIDAGALDGVDAVVNLSGASLSRLPWTPGYRRTILQSRVHATRTLTDAIIRAARPPAVLLNASAVGFYGDRPGEHLSESAPVGRGFLASVVQAWEQEAQRAADATRVVSFRTGLVLARDGALAPLIPLARLGLAGPLGSGRQHWPWISLHDEAAALVHLLGSSLSGPVNLVGPTSATASDVIRALADQLRRPYLLPVPAPILRLVLQDAADDLLLADQRVSSALLLADGFAFAQETPLAAVATMLDRR
ncbi:TIGR01777 family oxidoreductase [Glaciibacter sp. 2TAF33]|uniref:TIGR01777 family oxidoreductase n=1 Tax=Glaciibacter sp. 2TAF33 TaxID=3233015 RepID=UPI003F90BF1C